MSAFHPSGFRVMARASAEDLRRPALATIDSPTLLVYGDQDARAPSSVAEHLSRAIANSSIIVLPGVGHLCNLEDEHAFNAAVGTWLRNHT